MGYPEDTKPPGLPAIPGAGPNLQNYDQASVLRDTVIFNRGRGRGDSRGLRLPLSSNTELVRRAARLPIGSP